jgi:hypothetical protein
MSSLNGIHRYTRLALELGCLCQLLDGVNDSNSIDAAGAIMIIVLDFVADFNIHSLPGDEWNRLYELKLHCIHVERLLLRPVNTEAVREECWQAIGQLCYLLEMVSIAGATAVETLCFPREGSAWATIMTMYSNC